MPLTSKEFKELGELDRHTYIVNNFPATTKSTCKRGLVYGVGLNDAKYTVCPKVGSKQVMCPAYTMWKNMVERCYGKDSQKKYPSYVGVRVCDEWLVYSNFVSWWEANQVDGYQLDKDILSDSKVYSPENCLFVPSWLNMFMVKPVKGAADGTTGAYWDAEKGGWRVSMRDPINNGKIHSGVLKTAEDAHLYWRKKKLEFALILKDRMDEVDLRVYPRIIQSLEAPEGIPVMWGAPIAT